jgi:hypothetical protein
MSRLVKIKQVEDGARLAGTSKDSRAKEFLEQVSKFVPAEIISGYVAIDGFLSSEKSTNEQIYFYGAILNFIIFLILTPVYFNKIAESGDAKRTQLLTSTLAFIIWVYAVGGDSGIFGDPVLDIYNATISSCLLVLFSLVSGLITPKS